MKKFLTPLLAAALVLPTAAFAQPSTQQQQQPATKGEQLREQNAQQQQQSTKNQSSHSQQASNAQQHPFAKGQRFSRSKAPNYARLNYREHKKLSAPPKGHVWVRAGNDALLVRLSNNLIIKVVADVFVTSGHR